MILIIELVMCHAGGRFLFAYQIMIALAVYLMATAVVDSSPSLMLSRQTRMLLSAGDFSQQCLSCVLHHASSAQGTLLSSSMLEVLCMMRHRQRAALLSKVLLGVFFMMSQQHR